MPALPVGQTNAGDNLCLSPASMMRLWLLPRRWKRQEDRNNKKYGLELKRHEIMIIRVLWNDSTYN